MNKLACSHISLIKGRKKPSIDSVTKKKKSTNIPSVAHDNHNTECEIESTVVG